METTYELLLQVYRTLLIYTHFWKLGIIIYKAFCNKVQQEFMHRKNLFNEGQNDVCKLQNWTLFNSFIASTEKLSETYWTKVLYFIVSPALDLNDRYLKARLRRAQCYEHVEKLEEALEGKNL